MVTQNELIPYISTSEVSIPGLLIDPVVLGASGDVGVGAGMVFDVNSFTEGKGYQMDVDIMPKDFVCGVDDKGKFNYAGVALTAGPGLGISAAPTKTWSLRGIPLIANY